MLRKLIALMLVLPVLGAAGPDARQRTAKPAKPTAKPAAKPAAKPPAKPAARPARTAPKPTPAAVRTEAAKVTCPETLGTGITSGATYCFVLAGRDPQEGVLVTLPPRIGEATLRFDLHNRHTYSEEQMRAGRGFAAYTAVIGILTKDGELLDRAAIQTEFRDEQDLHERISGGAGPGGAKAVAPVGAEQIAIAIPPGVTEVSLLGEVLDATTAAGRELAAPGRPVAIVSNVTIAYRPAK